MKMKRALQLVIVMLVASTCNFIWQSDEYTFDRPEGSCVEGEPPPSDDRECTDDLCGTGAASQPPAPAGTPCQGDRVCDDVGECVPAHCINEMVDGDETDIDCGGTACPQCGNGLMCHQAADCTSGVCEDMHCKY